MISRSEHQHRRLLTFACGAVVSSDTLYTAAAWGASRNAIHTFYSVAVRDALSLCSLRSLLIVYNATNAHASYSRTQYATCTLEFRGDPMQAMGCTNPRTHVRINTSTHTHTHTFACTHHTSTAVNRHLTDSSTSYARNMKNPQISKRQEWEEKTGGGG